MPNVNQPPAYPEGCAPLPARCVDTHEGHFMGRGRNRLHQIALRSAGS